jgi:oligopeptide transport system substrate-binding protein
MKSTKKILSVLLAVGMLISVILLASCNGNKNNTTTSVETTESTTTTEKVTEEVTTSIEVTPFPDGTYTYKDAVGTLATNWNPHTYQTADDSYPASFIRTGLYGFVFNDELHPVEGKDPYEGYKIIPEMAASMPVDVTETIKASHPEFGIPADATKGYAYTIDLNPNAVWENGEKINADTYVYSMKRLLDPELLNYRAQDYMVGSFVIANAPNYYYQGSVSLVDNGTADQYNKSDLVKGEDDAYYTPDGHPVFIALGYPIEWCGGYSLYDYVDAYGEAYFDVTTWDDLVALMDDDGLVALTDANYELFVPVTTGNPAWGETEADIFNYLVVKVAYEDNYDFANVGVYKSGEYQITVVFGKSIAGFQLLYNLSSNWIVNETLYEANLSKVGDTDAWASTYNTSVETTLSYGPYKLVSYQKDKSMRFEKNETWYGYTDGNHVYVDPTDGKTYAFYQTTAVECQQVTEVATRKLMFLKGQLMAYGLQTEDVAEYRNSEYCYVSPSETIFFFIFNGYVEQLEAREANEGFDATKYDLQTMALKSFRKAIAVTYDKNALCEALFPDCSPGYGLIGDMYIYNPDTGAKYRDTDVAKQALCEFYSVDVSKYASLDEAVDSITGYDPVKAKELYTQAFEEALAAGYITDNDKDGKSDQIIYIEYCCSSVNEKMEQRKDILNEKAADVTKGTPFEGKIEFYLSAPYGNDWSTKIRTGLSDVVLGGWQGSALDPFGLSDLYVNPDRSYDAKWFDATKVEVTMTVPVDGVDKEITMTLKSWSDALNGVAAKDSKGDTYNFGEDQATVETRLAILAKIESTVLQTYDYIPMLQDGSLFLLTQQAYYVIEDYNPILGRGGIEYLKYNYNDAEWEAYVASQKDGLLSY